MNDRTKTRLDADRGEANIAVAKAHIAITKALNKLNWAHASRDHVARTAAIADLVKANTDWIEAIAALDRANRAKADALGLTLGGASTSNL
jgi:hypothetical protein